MDAGRGWGGFDRLLEEPGGPGADEGQHGGPAEDIDVSHEGGLLLHEAVEESEGAWAGLGGADVMGEVAGDGGGFLLQHRAGGGEVGARPVPRRTCKR